MSLIAHYKLDGNANDALGKYNGTASNVTWVDGKLGKAGSFNGNNAHVTLPRNQYTMPVSSFSLAFWVNGSSVSVTGPRYIFLSGRDMNNSGIGILRSGISTSYSFFAWIAGSIRSLSFSIANNSWNHVVCSYDANVGAKVFVNGVMVASHSYTGSIAYTEMYGSSPSIGSHGGIYFYNGLIDDVRIYDHALSEREVRDLSQGLVLHYTFDQFQEPTENLLRKSGATPLISAVDIYGRSTKTINADGSVRFVNNGTGVSTVRLNCNLADLSSGETYGVQVKFRENTGTVSFDWCDTSIINGVESSTQSSGLLYGIGTRATYDGTYRFLDINISSGGSVTLYEDQVEKKKYTTPYVNGTRAGIVRDQSTQGNDAPLALANTPKWVEGGMVGKGCYEFTQDGKHIDTGNKFNFKKTDSFTVGFWINPEDHSAEAAAAGGVIGKGHWFDNTWDVFIFNANFLRFECSGNATRNGIAQVGSPVLPLHQWSHFVVTYDAGSITCYLNGQVVGTTTYSGTGDFSNNNNVVIGMRYGDVSRTLKGQLDDVRIYTTALSAGGVKELYQQRVSLDSGGNLLC